MRLPLIASLPLLLAATLPAQQLVCVQNTASIRPTEFACFAIQSIPPTPGLQINASSGAACVVFNSGSAVTDTNGLAYFAASPTGIDLSGSNVFFTDNAGTFTQCSAVVFCDHPKLTIGGEAGSQPGFMSFELRADPPVDVGDWGLMLLSPFPGQIPLGIFQAGDPRFFQMSAANLLLPPGFAGPFQFPYDIYFAPGFGIPNFGVNGLAFFLQGASLDLTSPLPWERLSQPEPVYLGFTDTFIDRFKIMNIERSFFPVIERQDQKVMAIGGGQGSIFAQIATDQCDVYDPVTDSWTVNATSMTEPRSLHTATKLQNGKYLIVGGVDSINDPIATAEIYDPTTNTFYAVGTMSVPRVGHSATLLPSGQVLIAGGMTVIVAGAIGLITTVNSAEDTTEIFTLDSTQCTGSFSAGPTMSRGRAGHSALELADGRIFMVGGVGPGFLSIPTTWRETEFYDSGNFNNGPSMASARAIFPIVKIEEQPDRYLVAGGLGSVTGLGAPTSSAEIYTASPNQPGSWSSAGSMTNPRGIQGAYRIGDEVVQIGGISGDLVTPSSEGSTEIYDINSGTWSMGPNMVVPRGAFGHYRAPYGQIHILGGAAGFGPSPAVDFSTEWYFTR